MITIELLEHILDEMQIALEEKDYENYYFLKGYHAAMSEIYESQRDNDLYKAYNALKEEIILEYHHPAWKVRELVEKATGKKYGEAIRSGIYF